MNNLKAIFMKLVFSILLLYLPTLLSGQALTLDELLRYQKMDLIKLNDVLALKEWELSSSETREDDVKAITWAYGKTYDEAASAWLYLHYNPTDKDLSYLTYQVHDTKTYTAIKNRMEQFKMKLLETAVEENEINSAYQGQTMTVIVGIEPGEPGKNSKYHFAVFTNKYYALFKFAGYGLQSDPGQEDALDVTNYNDDSGDKRTYTGKYIYISKAYSYAPLYTDFGLGNKVYQVAPDENVYVLVIYDKSIYGKDKVWVYCNGHYGYMDKSMLKED